MAQPPPETLHNLYQTIHHIQQNVAYLQSLVDQSMVHRYQNVDDVELTSVPYWYQNSPIFRFNPYNAPVSNGHQWQPPSTHVHAHAPPVPPPRYDHTGTAANNHHQEKTTVSGTKTKTETIAMKTGNVKRANATTVQKSKRRQKQKPKKPTANARLDMNDQQTLQSLGASQEMMKFFYNGEIQRNRLRVEKQERERAVIEAIPTVQQQQKNETQRRHHVYGVDNHANLQRKEMMMDAAFIQSVKHINRDCSANQKLVCWPATPLTY